MVNIVTKTSTTAQQSQREQHFKIATNNNDQVHVTANSTTKDSHQPSNSKFYSYARHSREASIIKERCHRWQQQRRRLQRLQPAVLLGKARQAPAASGPPPWRSAPRPCESPDKDLQAVSLPPPAKRFQGGAPRCLLILSHILHRCRLCLLLDGK